MKAEEMLRREMHRALDGMPDELDLEARFQSRRRRYRRIQVIQMVATAAVFAAIAVVVVPRLGGEDVGLVPPASSGSPDPTTTAGASVTDSTVGYEVSLPDGWINRHDEGALAAFGPPEAGRLGDPGSANVPSQFYVLLTPTTLRYQDELDRLRTLYEQLATAGAQTTETQTTVAEHPAVSWGVVYPEAAGEEFAGDEGWCPGCRVSDYLVNWSHGYTIRIEVVARSAEANEQWYPQGLQIVAGFSAVEGAPYAPASGTVADGIPIDDATETVLQFMDARVAGEGAEMWLSQNAKDLYAAGPLSLYAEGAPRPYTSYDLVSREQVDANSWEYRVSINSDGDGVGSTHVEFLSVGPGTNHRDTRLIHVIRAARGEDR